MSHPSAIHSLLAALFVVSAAACDPVDTTTQAPAKAAGNVAGAARTEPAAAAATPTDAAASPASPGAAGGAEAMAAGSAPAPAAVDPVEVARTRQLLGDYESCAQSCFADYSTAKETNVETCRLNCSSVAETAGVREGSPAHRLMNRYDGCLGDCFLDKKVKETDRETCKLNCSALLDTLEAELKGAEPPVDPGKSAPVATACAQQCVTSAVNCQRACGEARVKETDRATCNLTCTQNSDLCLERCSEASPPKAM